VRLVAPGLPPETQTHSASLLTILFPNVLLVALVALFKAYLNAQHRFAVPALAQVLVPGTIALALILLAQRIGIDCMAFGSVAGWGLALLAVVAAAYRSGFRYRWVLDLRSPPIRQMTRLFPPVVIGSVATSMVILTNQIMASLLPEGSLAELGYALKVGDIPATLFGMALAHVAYPVLAWNAAEEQLDRLKDNFALAVRMSLLINVPMAIGVIALSVPIVELLFARGSFSGEAVRWTAWTLAAYTIGMPMRGARAITMHALWALKDSRTPMVLGLRNVIYNIVFNLIFMHFFGVAGLALSTSLVNTIFLAGLMWRLRLRLGGVGGRAIASTALRILAAAGIMGGAVGGTYWATSSLLETLSEPARLVNVLAPIAVGAVVYGAAVFALRVKEAAMVLDIVKKKLGRSP
jgi:putative peptidoglycan lipid II flippase